MRSIEVRVALVLALYSMDEKLLGLGPVRPVSLLFSFSFASHIFVLRRTAWENQTIY